MRDAQVNLAMRWFAGYGMAEALPDHSSLARIRQRWSSARFRAIFARVVGDCLGAGMVSGDVVHTKLRFATMVATAVTTLAFAGAPTMSLADTACLEITLTIAPADRAAAGVYAAFKEPFLTTVQRALTKQLLIRDADVQVLHGFETVAHAEAYLQSDLFNQDGVGALAPLLQADPQGPDLRGRLAGRLTGGRAWGAGL